ncbi:MAG: hypothetical protein IJ322_05700 [Clostridia bacterium]|nr:hypothetical protein [Clostridia bacterium]
MNKKLLFLMVGMIVCLTIIGGALAAAYYDAPSHNVTVGTDSAIVLSLDNSTSLSGITLNEGKSTVYTVQADVSKSANATANATLVITVGELQDKNLDNVVFGLYSDAGCTQAVGTNTINEGAGSITVSGITVSTTYYLKVELPEKGVDTQYSAAELQAMGGTINIRFTQGQ